ncbi:uncharacterized protein LOC120415550 [Culex pipiens pallens]|uniref:uncharacterized protein LOC120415550 n=1 Tax=Culex pipiens pallens TaxID=42434 RepID=UPI0019549F37|nr:uncharacterized protein LOC120415550 [Culex pipiens pallens]
MLPSPTMSSTVALSLAVLLHLGLKIQVFMDPPSEFCSLSLNLRSILFLSSVVMYLSTTRIFPRRYRKLPSVAMAVVEFFFFLLAIEFGMVVFWCRFEAFLFKVLDCLVASKSSVIYADISGDKLVEFVLTLCSILTFACTAIATGYVSLGARVYDTIAEKLQRLTECVRQKQEPQRICPEHLCRPVVEGEDTAQSSTMGSSRNRSRSRADDEFDEQPARALRARNRTINYSEFARRTRRSSSRRRN